MSIGRQEDEDCLYILFTKRGREVGDRLVKLSCKTNEYSITHYINAEIHGGIKSIIPYLLKEYEGLIFVSATGIAVRLMKPYIIDKTKDPAVVVVRRWGLNLL